MGELEDLNWTEGCILSIVGCFVFVGSFSYLCANFPFAPSEVQYIVAPSEVDCIVVPSEVVWGYHL